MDFTFKAASENDVSTIKKLYKDALENPFCTWNEYYPSDIEINGDIENKNLFILYGGEAPVGAISIVSENELDGFDFWETKEDAAEIARVVVAKEFIGRGISEILVENAEKTLKAQGKRALHLAAALKNIPAQRCYKARGFIKRGKSFMYGHDFILMEKPLA